MTTLAQIARQNRRTALAGLAHRRAQNVLTVDFATRTKLQPAEPVLSFAARRQACPELAASVAARAVPPAAAARGDLHPLLLVSDSAQQLAA